MFISIQHSYIINTPIATSVTKSTFGTKSSQINEKNIIYHPDGYIIGNPLLTDKCRNAIINKIPNEVLYSSPNLINDLIKQHWFISKESYSAIFTHYHHIPINDPPYSRNHRYLPYWATAKIQTLISKGFNNSNTTSYINIDKSASSTTTARLHQENGEFPFEQNVANSNDILLSNCTFTFVRDPLQRFVSAYYTVSKLMWDIENNPDIKYEKDRAQIAHIRTLFKYLSVNGEPDRFRAFVDDLSVFESVFVFGNRHLQHLMSQTAKLSVADISRIGGDIEWFTHPERGRNDNRMFIGRVEQYKEHWKKLTQVCDDIVMFENDFKSMAMYGTRSTLNETYLKMMGLENRKDGDILPAYYAIDNMTFAKIVNYYYQDYICFGYQPKLPDFLRTISSDVVP